MESIEITNCNDCPMLEFGGYEGEESYCWLDKRKRRLNNKLFGKVENIPKWCNLKKHDIVIKMK